MRERLFSILELVRPSLPSALIDDEGYARLAAIAKMLPAEMTTFWGFECRLGEPEAKADLLFETHKHSRGLRLLAGQTPSALDSLCEQWPAWRHLRRFAAQWAEPEHLFREAIRNIWLEFDIAALAPGAQFAEAVRQPCIFFGPEAKTLEKDRLLRVVLEALGALGESNAGRFRLQTFIARLPEGAQLFQVGRMLSRMNQGLRVCVNTVPPETIPAWLAALNWDGDSRALERLLRPITPMLKTTAIDLNLLNGRPAEKIGLECYMDWLEDDPAQWNPLFDLIETRDLCLPRKRQGLLDFPGVTRSPILQRLSGDGVMHLHLFRKIHHLKFTISGGQVVEAKAYLALSRPGVHLRRMFPGRFGDSEDAGHAWLIE